MFGYIRSEGVAMFNVKDVVVERRGTGTPLVLLHGIGHRWQAWQPVLDPLAERHDVIAIDLPGFGGSPTLPDDRPYDMIAAVPAIVVDLVGVGATVERPAPGPPLAPRRWQSRPVATHSSGSTGLCARAGSSAGGPSGVACTSTCAQRQLDARRLLRTQACGTPIGSLLSPTRAGEPGGRHAGT